MSRHSQPFRFKQFEVSHHRSSMKVGVDAVILGAWADISEAASVLDVGCGCGVIALMCAQRNEKADIMAIDIHEPSIEEAAENFNSSPWRERLYTINSDFVHFCNNYEGRLDYIISNPPYFDSGIETPETAREKARHQGDLSPEIIIRYGKKILQKGGKIGMVIPFEQSSKIIELARSLDMAPCRRLTMRGREGNQPKRAFIEIVNFRRALCIAGSLCIEKEDGTFTDEYRELCRDFYLKF